MHGNIDALGNKTAASPNQALADELSEKLKEKFRDTLTGLIPDHHWEAMITHVVETFIEKELKAIVEAEVKAEIQRRIGAFFKQPEWEGRWDYTVPTTGNATTDLQNQLKPGTYVQQFMQENAETFAKAFVMQIMGATVQNVMSQVASQFRNH